MRRLPSPEHTVDVPAHALRAITPLLFMIVLCFVFMNTVRFVSIEKEKQLKVAMKIMGLTSWMHYLGWFIRTVIMLSISMIIISILLTVKHISRKYYFNISIFIQNCICFSQFQIPCFGASSAIFPKSSFLGLFIFFISYCISLITFSFMICAFFAKAKSAVTAAMALWFVTSG